MAFSRKVYSNVEPWTVFVCMPNLPFPPLWDGDTGHETRDCHRSASASGWVPPCSSGRPRRREAFVVVYLFIFIYPRPRPSPLSPPSSLFHTSPAVSSFETSERIIGAYTYVSVGKHVWNEATIIDQWRTVQISGEFHSFKLEVLLIKHFLFF